MAHGRAPFRSRTPKLGATPAYGVAFLFALWASELIDRAYAEKKNGPDVQFGQMIEEERQKRLSTIDADTAAEQARVEQIEREYEARLKRERDGVPAPTTPAPAPQQF